MTGQEKGEEAGGCGCLRIDIPGRGALLLKADRILSSLVSTRVWHSNVAGGQVKSPAGRCQPTADCIHRYVIGGLTGRIKGERANRVPLDIESKHLPRVPMGTSTKGSAQAHSFGTARGKMSLDSPGSRSQGENSSTRGTRGGSASLSPSRDGLDRSSRTGVSDRLNWVTRSSLLGNTLRTRVRWR